MNAYFCGQCGSRIPADSIFCPMCGSRADAMPPVATAPARRTPVHAQPAQPAPEFHHAPAQPAVRVPTTRQPLRIAFGSLFIGVAILLAVWFLPGDQPIDLPHVAGSMSAAVFALFGIGLVLSGALHRAEAEVRCRLCARPVLAEKGAFGLHCPLGPHYARVNWFLVAITAAFWAGLLVSGLVLAIWLA